MKVSSFKMAGGRFTGTVQNDFIPPSQSSVEKDRMPGRNMRTRQRSIRIEGGPNFHYGGRFRGYGWPATIGLPVLATSSTLHPGQQTSTKA